MKIVAWGLIAVATVCAHPAAAQSSAAPQAISPSQAPQTTPAAANPVEAAADAAFLRGSELAKSNQWEAALAAYEESARIKGHPRTTYDIGFCERKLGRYVRASLHFEEVVLAADYYSLPQGLVSDATRLLEATRSQIVHVSIVRRPQDLTITVDGMPLKRAKTASGPVYIVGTAAIVPNLPPGDIDLLVDPGTHVFVGAGPGGSRVSESRTFADGQQGIVTLQLPERAAAVVPPPAPEKHDAAVPEPNHTAAYVAFGVGGLGLVGAAVFGGLALSEKSTLESACTGKVCAPEYADVESRMRTFSDIATVSTVTFAVGAAVGTYLLLTASSPAKTPSARITPWFAGESGGVFGRFFFL